MARPQGEGGQDQSDDDDTEHHRDAGCGRQPAQERGGHEGTEARTADNGHALHPNHGEYADPVNAPRLNEGIVIKFNAQQKYATDGFSAAFFRDLCRRVEVPTQTFTNRSDIPGGSTLGNISNTKVSMPTVDIGLPQLAMHSSYETAGTKDTAYLVMACTAFFE